MERFYDPQPLPIVAMPQPMILRPDQLQSITDAVPALVCYVDADCRYRMCNRAYASWLRLTPALLVGRSMPEVLGAAAWASVGPHVRAALHGQAQDFEAAFEGPNEQRCWVHAVYTPHRDAGGTVTGVVMMAIDITTKKLAELNLRDSEARFRALVSQVTVGIAQVDLTGLFCLVNQRYCEIVGYREEELLQLRMQDITHPDDLEPNVTKFMALASGGPDFIVEKRYIRRDGSLVWVHNNVAAVRDPEGKLKGIVAVVLDITERQRAEAAVRESEARFRNMSNHSPMMLWVSDASGWCTHLNERWFEFTGQTPETGLGAGWRQAIHPTDLPLVDAVFHDGTARHESFRIEFRLRRRDGTYRWALVVASPRFSETGEFLGFIGSVIDIQERKETEIALREAKEQAEKALRAKDNFLAQLSHELRTPLTPVLMTAAALREDESLPAAVRQQLGMIERNVALEARLIDDLLDLTRITHGRLELRPEACDLHLLLHLVAEIVRDEAREKRIHIDLQLAATRRGLEVDPARLQQVFWNILRNAVKFTPEGGRICIRSFDAGPAPQPDNSESRNATREPATTASRGAVAIEVMDNGIGFPPEEAQLLFEPFQRGTGADHARTAGLGLGLSIARAIVKLHAGSIEAESDGLGRGATFRVILPEAARVDEGGVAPAEAVPPLPAGSHRPLRLLLVEDHEPTQQVLARLLERDGHCITRATTMAGALEAAERQQFDAVLSDLGLPDGTGFELMQHLRVRQDLRGIALSGYGMAEDVRRSEEAGFIAHLTKPVSLNDVRRVLRQSVGVSPQGGLAKGVAEVADINPSFRLHQPSLDSPNPATVSLKPL
jgi:PAS domain S-box-containing protein